MFVCRVLCFILCFSCVSCFLVSCFVLRCAGFCVRFVLCFVSCLSCFVVCFYRFDWYFELLLRIFSYELYFSSICPFLLFPTLKSNPRLGVLQGPFPLPPPLPLTSQNGCLNLLVAALSPSVSSSIVEKLLVVDPFRTGIIIRAVVDLLIVRVGM